MSQPQAHEVRGSDPWAGVDAASPPTTHGASELAAAPPQRREAPLGLWRRRKPFGLRTRATLVFAVVAAALTSVTAFAVWGSVSGYLLQQRQRAAVDQAVEHADRLEIELARRDANPAELLYELPRDLGASTSLLLTSEEEWFSSSLNVGPTMLPVSVRTSAAEGTASSQRAQLDTGPVLVIGVPLPDADATYYEVFALDQLEETFEALSWLLLAAVVLVPAATFFVGWWAMRPALRPLTQVSQASASIAAGDLGARLDPVAEPSLIPIAESFNRTAEALERRVQADARFAADVSHELRTPLTTIVASVDYLADHADRMPLDDREIVQHLRSEVGRLGRLVDDLLEISRSDAGSSEPLVQDVVLAELIRRSMPAPLIDRLTVTEEGERAVCAVDKRRFERMLRNLINNAEQHGGGLTQVTLDCAEGTVTLSVEDAGPGLRDDELEQIFDRFSRGRRSTRGDTDGAGLGLALVARFVALMGGRVHAENADTAGARFVITLHDVRARRP